MLLFSSVQFRINRISPLLKHRLGEYRIHCCVRLMAGVRAASWRSSFIKIHVSHPGNNNLNWNLPSQVTSQCILCCFQNLDLNSADNARHWDGETRHVAALHSSHQQQCSEWLLVRIGNITWNILLFITFICPQQNVYRRPVVADNRGWEDRYIV